MTKLDRVTNQWTSGRFLITQIVGACLLMITLTDCYVAVRLMRAAADLSKVNFKDCLPFDVGQIFIVIVAVVTAYFHNPAGADETPDVSTPDKLPVESK